MINQVAGLFCGGVEEPSDHMTAEKQQQRRRQRTVEAPLVPPFHISEAVISAQYPKREVHYSQHDPEPAVHESPLAVVVLTRGAVHADRIKIQRNTSKRIHRRVAVVSRIRREHRSCRQCRDARKDGDYQRHVYPVQIGGFTAFVQEFVQDDSTARTEQNHQCQSGEHHCLYVAPLLHSDIGHFAVAAMSHGGHSRSPRGAGPCR